MEEFNDKIKIHKMSKNARRKRIRYYQGDKVNKERIRILVNMQKQKVTLEAMSKMMNLPMMNLPIKLIEQLLYQANMNK